MSTIWVLILFAHVGPLGDGNSNAITTQEFTSQQKCSAAGNAAKALVRGTVKQMEFVCVEK
jgi:hypothetical protein